MARNAYQDSMYQIFQASLLDKENTAKTSYRDIVDADGENKQNVCILELFDPKGKLIFCVSHIRNSDIYNVEMPDYKLNLSDEQKEALYNMMQNREKLINAEKIRKSKKYRFAPKERVYG